MKGRKTGGRQAGTPNRVTAEVKKAIAQVVQDEVHKLSERMDELTAKERIDVLTKLLPYTLPRITERSMPPEMPAPNLPPWMKSSKPWSDND